MSVTSYLKRQDKWVNCETVVKMIIVFFDVRGFLHREFVLPDQTINQHIYLGLARECTEEVPETLEINILAHTALSQLTTNWPLMGVLSFPTFCIHQT